jgi:hypothetical protein
LVVTAQLVEAACRARVGQTRHDAIEERVTELAYPGTTKSIVIEKV